jgi:hypothetical protein
MITTKQLQEQGIALTDFFDNLIAKRQTGELDEAFTDIMELSRKQRKLLLEYIEEVAESGQYGDIQTALESVKNLTFKLL